MLVVSKFHDYYDSLMRQGVDKSLVYKRETVEGAMFLEFPRAYALRDGFEEHVDKRVRLQWNRHVIVFCGRVYIFWRGNSLVKRGDQYAYDGVFYRDTEKELLAIMRGCYDLPEPKQRAYRWYQNFSRKDDSVGFDEAVSNFDWNPIHRKLMSPVLAVRGIGNLNTKHLPPRDYASGTGWFQVVTNPVLKDVGFERIVDPFTAWQEIAMYMGGVIGQPDRPMVKLNDVELRDKRGFDNWSFKKRPAA